MWYMVCGIYNVVYGIWYVLLAYGMWYVVCNIWYVVNGIWHEACGMKHVVYG